MTTYQTADLRHQVQTASALAVVAEAYVAMAYNPSLASSHTVTDASPQAIIATALRLH